MASHNSHPLPTPPGQGHQSQQPQLQQPQQQGYFQDPLQQQQQRYPQQYQHQQQSQPPQPPAHQYQKQQLQPPQQQQQKPRPRSRGFSFRSDKSHKSHKSSGSKDHHHKIDLHETAAEKESKRLHTKADPSVAMNEAEPSAVQATAKTSLAPLRGIQHKDALGNPIADPDRSNPTRSRWERPLDTIRSFEAAIDGGYNRKSYIRSDSDSIAGVNPRRNSYYGTNSGPNGGGGRFPHDSYYGGRPQSTFRLDEQPSHYPRQSPGPGRESYLNDGQPGYSNAYSPGPNGAGRQRYPRTASEPHFNSYRQQADPNVYPIPNNHRSYETVASASGSGTSGEQAGYQTDLTSDNSSAERVQAVQRQKREAPNDYGIGFGQNPAFPSTAFNVGANGSNVNTNSPLANGYPVNGAQTYGAPPVPTKDVSKGSLLRKTTNQSTDRSDKRKSWFSKKFSKNS